MNSCLYECQVTHRRVHPKIHAFRYALFMMYIDLAELEELGMSIPCFSHNGFNIYAFHDGDHQPEGGKSLRESLAAYMKKEGFELESEHRVTLLTLPRVAGYIFNPVSFYFVTDAAGAALCAVAEVGNTFKEKKLYFIPSAGGQPGRLRCRIPKYFYVSPYSSLDLEFEFNLTAPAGRLDIQINDYEADRPVLFSRLSGGRAELTALRLLVFLIKYPLLTVGVISRIHWQAALLYLKRIPFYRKGENVHLQREVLNPHPSLLTAKK